MGPELPGEGRQFASAEAGHDGVGDQQGDVFDGLQHGFCLDAVAGFEHRVAQFGELLADHLTYFGFVLDQEHQALLIGDAGRGGAEGLRGGRGGVGHRHDEAHVGALARGAENADVAARLANEAIHHGQAEAAAGAEGLGGEEGLEEAWQEFRRNAGTGVGDVELHVVAGRHFNKQGEAAGNVAARHRDGQLAALGHRVAGVDGQVEEGVFELVRVDQRMKLFGGQVEVDVDALGEGARQQLGHAVHQRTDFHRAGRQRLLAREGEQAADQFGAAAGRRQGRFQVVVEALVGGQFVLQRGQVAGDDGEQVVEVVGESAGELADGFHLLGLDQCGLAGLLFGDVDGQHEEALYAAGNRGFRYHRAAGIYLAAVGVGARVLVADLLATGGLLEIRLDLDIGFGPEDFGDAAPDDALLVGAEPLGVALVGEEIVFAGVHVGDQCRNGVHDEAQAFFAAGQLGSHVVEAGGGRFEFGGAGAHAGFQVGVLAFDELFVAALFGDIGPQGDEAQVGNRHATDRQDLPVGAGAFGVVGLEGANGGHAFGYQTFDFGVAARAAAVLAALDVEAHEGLERRADAHHVFGKVEQAQQGLVPGNQLGRGVEDRDGLVEEVEAGQQQVVAAQLFRGAGAGARCAGRDGEAGGHACHRAMKSKKAASGRAGENR